MPVSAEPRLVETGSAMGGAPGQDWQARLNAFTNQPAFRRALPAIIGVGSLAVIAMLYLAIAGSPQRILYASLSDGERAKVVQALETGGIGYSIDNGTGAITVAEDDVYRARMLVASDAGLASPQGASEMLDAIPLGSSRTLEGERMRLARERELMLTIQEIDGIEAVRVHLATPERSVFVRSSNPPSASVMLRLVSGRSLSQPQVEAIVNLVSGSVPGMTADAVRVVDQNGRLLSDPRDADMEGLTLQREFEAKLQSQLASLLTPLLGDGNFSSQVQVELDQSEVTSARETYDKDGAVRSESERNATRMNARQPGGVPGVPANTPPPEADLLDGPPQPNAEAAPAETAPEASVPSDTESAVQRNFELDREVAVTATRSGGLTKLSVAVAVSQEAMVAAAPLTPEELEKLVSAGLIIKGNFSDDRYDRTCWYALGNSICPNGQIDPTERENDAFAPEGKPSAPEGKSYKYRYKPYQKPNPSHAKAVVEDEISEKILSAYPEDRIRSKAVCLAQIRQALADGVDAKDLEDAVRAYATESEGFTRSKVCFSDNWFTSGRWLKYLQDVEEAREAGKAKEAELLKGLADWVTDRHPLCRHITPGQIDALLAAELVTQAQIQAAGLRS